MLETEHYWLDKCLFRYKYVSRFLTLLTVVIVSISLAATGAVAVPAEPPSDGAAASSGGTNSSADHLATERLTLITGDTVRITERGNETTYRVENNASATVQTVPSGTYVIPDDVDMSKFDRSLFNVELLRQQGLTDTKSSTIPLIVSWSNHTDQSARRMSVSGPRKQNPFRIINATAIDATKDESNRIYRALANNPDVEAVHYDTMVNATSTSGTGFNTSRAHAAYNVSGDNVTVAVLDSGVNESHPDLDDAEIGEVDLTGEGTTGDLDDHGTPVAGLIAGDGTVSNRSYRGVAPDASILDVRVLNRFGSGRISNVIAGIEYAVENDADVISMSLGFESTTIRRNDPVREATRAASVANINVVSSAGNGGEYGTITSPGTLRSVTTVGATTNGSVAAYSSRGPTPRGGYLKPNLVAPGTSVSTTSATGGYDTYTGTSFAAPSVSGTVALLRAAHPNWTAQQIRNVMLSSTDSIDAGPYAAGSGQLNATAALDQSVVVAPATIDFGRLSVGESATRSVRVTNTDTETRELDLSASATVLGSDRPGTVSVNQSSVTLGPNESRSISLTVNTSNAVTVPYAGYLRVDDATAVFGYVPEQQVTVTKHGESITGDQVTLVNDDSGTVYGPREFRDSSVTFDVDQRGQFTAVSTSQSDEQPIVTVGTTNATENNTVILDESTAVTRTLDTESLPEPADRLRNRTIVVNATFNNLPVDVRVRSDDPQLAAVRVTPTERMSYSFRRVITVAPAGAAYDTPTIYHLKTTPETIAGPVAASVDVEALNQQRVRYYRGTSNETYSATVGADNFDDVPLSESYVSSGIGDQFDQRIYVSPSISQYHDAFSLGRFGFISWSATPENIIVPFNETGITTTAIKKQPYRTKLASWSLSTEQFRASLFPTVGQPPNGYVISDTPVEQYDLWIDGERVRSETRNRVLTSFSAFENDIDSVRLRVRDQHDISPLSNDTVTTFAAETAGSDNRPPTVPSITFESLTRSNVIPNGIVNVSVSTSDADGGVETVKLYTAQRGPKGSPTVTPFENSRDWQTVPLTATGNGTYSGVLNLTEYRGTLSIAVNATDHAGNTVETTATDAIIVDSRIPVANATSNATLVEPNQTIHLDAGDSYDDLSISEYRWDVEGDGTVDERTEKPVVNTEYDQQGVYQPTVTVVDTDGRTDTFSFDVTVARGLSTQTEFIGERTRADIRTGVQNGNTETFDGVVRGIIRIDPNSLFTINQTLNGNVRSAGGSTVVVSESTVNGNIRSHNQVVESSTFNSQLHSSGSVTVVGDLTTVRGNIRVDETLRLAPSTEIRAQGQTRTERLVVGQNASLSVRGNIQAGEVVIKPGASIEINGQLQCTNSLIAESATVSVAGQDRCTVN